MAVITYKGSPAFPKQRNFQKIVKGVGVGGHSLTKNFYCNFSFLLMLHLYHLYRETVAKRAKRANSMVSPTLCNMLVLK